MGQHLYQTENLARHLDKAVWKYSKPSPLIAFKNSLFVLQYIFINDHNYKNEYRSWDSNCRSVTSWSEGVRAADCTTEEDRAFNAILYLFIYKSEHEFFVVDSLSGSFRGSQLIFNR